MSNPPVVHSPNANLSVVFVEIDENYAGQRIDNFLITRLKGVPKSRIYRLLRKGEVRVNKGRIKAEYKLKQGDQVRIPPIRVAERPEKPQPGQSLRKVLQDHIIFENESLIILDKPSGLAVHGGSGVSLGVIESLRVMFPQYAFLELVHRLDRETSGCLMIAKKRAMLKHLQQQMIQGQVEKRYTALVQGQWKKHISRFSAPLKKIEQASGQKIVRVNEQGKPSVTHFSVVKRYASATLIEAKLETGRTHQIRVHCQYAGTPLAGDDKYGDDVFNQSMRELGLKRLFLHSHYLAFKLPDGEKLSFNCPLPKELTRVLDQIEEKA